MNNYQISNVLKSKFGGQAMTSNYVEISEWEIIRCGWDPENNRFYESIFSLGNEYMGLRGFFEEKYTGDTLKGIYTAGLYYPDKTRVGWWKNGYPEFFAKVPNNTNWVGVGISLNGKELDLGSGEYTVKDFVRKLDMRTATYSRTFVVCDKAGRETSFGFTRFLSMDNKNSACITVDITPLNYNGHITIRPYLDGNVVNEDANYNEVFWNRVSEQATPYPAVTMETKKTFFRQTCSMACSCDIDGKKISAKANILREKYVEQEFEALINQKECISLTKIVCVCTSRDVLKDSLENTCLLILNELIREGPDTLFINHCLTMKKLWDLHDVRIGGDPKAQQGIRYNILQLMLTYSGADPRLNIGPKGFTGEKYGGMTYWDTEAFCLPFYLYSDAVVARNLLLYRYRHLEMAKENAQKLGLDGALYPMVTIDGRECHNEWEITFEEIHRNGAIAYAIYNYVNFTGDVEYLKDYGLEILVELSRFWASRVTYNKRKDCYMLLGVTGPNEYENNVNNNFHTNNIAAWTIEYTLRWLEKYRPKNMPDIDELGKWRDISSKMYYPYVEELGIFEQNDLYMDKELLSADAIPKSERPINQHWSWDKVLRSCYIKQADVLQNLYFFPEKYSIEEQRRNFDFYEPMTVHESSLSASVYSVVANRIGYKEKAYELYMRTARLDLENANNDTHEGLHITSMGATWMAVIQGFAGVIVTDGSLVIDPHIPDNWIDLSFIMFFRGSQLNISIKNDSLEVRNQGNHLNISVRGRKHSLGSGERVKIDLCNTEQREYKAAIFDLDGVIVDTARYHYLAWKQLAHDLGFEFHENDNEKLKGVSREKSLEILLATGNILLDESEKKRLLEAKNSLYLEYISTLDENDVLPGTRESLLKLKAAGIKTAIGSASKNTPLIIEKLGIGNLFDVIVDGNSVQKTKPDPQCFKQCAQNLNIMFNDCVVFEDSEAGLQAAKAAGMYTIGVGNPKNFQNADMVISGLDQFIKAQQLFGMSEQE